LDAHNKARVAGQHQGEFAFHVFYMLLDGVDRDTAVTLRLSRDPAAYAYINGGTACTYVSTTGLPVARGEQRRPFASAQGGLAFTSLLQQMRESGFSDESLNQMKSVLAIVLHIGASGFPLNRICR
jgi:myosin heavy subunit